MSVGHDDGQTPPAPRVLTSAPWVVVVLGVGLLTALLLIVLFSLRGPEPVRQAAPAPAPPMYLPTMSAPTASAPPADVPLASVDANASPTPSGSESPSPKASSARPSASAAGAPGVARTGTVTARYQVTRSERDFFEARLTVTNGSARSQNWRVELLFGGNVKSVQASSASGVSVSSQGNGVFVLTSTGPLGSGGSATVQMRFTRTGTGDRPGECTVNGAACAIG
ncbi:Cellulose binding domain-containing protein [Micromonospora rhizosphaerae]|uniref:Cellulose binding domain-containing protein n=1 Tax=Micromonospora rhizosphaerae TaxID=568872 RepID=A0A1C6T5W0_9ACTN|nr:cellulose binding domain-containing protein [Micromonospora rhizosphaerae]SCL36923.1 Cellulose binding domain-containing protein [Micromonospora rhizosphaerae]